MPLFSSSPDEKIPCFYGAFIKLATPFYKNYIVETKRETAKAYGFTVSLFLYVIVCDYICLKPVLVLLLRTL